MFSGMVGYRDVQNRYGLAAGTRMRLVLLLFEQIEALRKSCSIFVYNHSIVMVTLIYIRIYITNVRNTGGSMTATILPQAIILTKAYRTAVSMIAKGCIVV